MNLRIGLNAAMIRRGGLVQVPKEVLAHLKMEHGDILAFETQNDGSVRLVPAEVKVRGEN